jgi:hypothetical protein
MRRAVILSLLVLGILPAPGCASRAETLCEELCDELVMSCGYEAYPSLDSCLRGCEWDIEQGADVEAERTCVLEAACDTFKVIECQHRHGAGG